MPRSLLVTDDFPYRLTVTDAVPELDRRLSDELDRTCSRSAQVVGRHHVGELAVEVHAGRLHQLVGAQPGAVGPDPVEGVGGVEREEHVVPEVATDAGRVSQQWFVVMPQTTRPSTPSEPSQASRSGEPWNEEFTDFFTSRSGVGER